MNEARTGQWYHLAMLVRSGAILLALLCVPSVARADDPKSMTLADAYTLALKTNERVAIARAGVTEAEIRARETWNQVTPTIDASAQVMAQREITIGMQVFQPGRQLIAGARLQQPVLRKGFFASRDAAEQHRAGATSALAREREQLARDVADVYLGVLRTRALRELARAAVDRTVALREHTAGRVKAGGALRTAELLAQLEVQRAQRQYLNTLRDVGVAQAAFTRVIGREPPLQLAALPIPAVPDRAKAGERSQKRADLQSLQRRVAETAARRESAVGQRWWPTFDVEASVQYYSPEVLNNAVDWRVIGVLTIPILRGGSEYTNLALRANEARIAALELEAQKRLVTDEVDVAGVELGTAEETAKLADTQLKTAREHYALVEKQFKLGAITFLEVTNAESVLAEAESANELARSERIRAGYQYLFAIGGSELSAASE
jgi:outer membrane protein TolC